jgi:hypothetical protein
LCGTPGERAPHSISQTCRSAGCCHCATGGTGTLTICAAFNRDDEMRRSHTEPACRLGIVKYGCCTAAPARPTGCPACAADHGAEYAGPAGADSASRSRKSHRQAIAPEGDPTAAGHRPWNPRAPPTGYKGSNAGDPATRQPRRQPGRGAEVVPSPQPGAFHSHVRHFTLQARIFLACPPSCSA